MENKKQFAFGKNWQDFLQKKYNLKSLEKSKIYLKDFLDGHDIKDKTFLDVGCGSGIHSLAALELGAKKVFSIDVDKDSVECTESLRDNKNDGYNWEIREVSLLDDKEINQLGKFDFVYCWGVAHHTGDMWRALDNLAKLVSDDGFLILAIYNEVPGKFGSKTWHYIKKFYVNSNFFIKKLMEITYVSSSFLKLCVSSRRPFKFIKKYKEKRGMDWKVDLIDWLGGYPYEYASVEDIFNFYKKNYSMTLVNLKTTNYIGNNQFLLKK